MVRRTYVDAANLGSELHSLQEQGLIRELIRPRPFFGRPHKTVFSLTEEGHSHIVEIHRSQQSAE